MNLKKIVSVFAAASMLAAMAVNASAYTYGSSEVTANGVKTTTYTWTFAESNETTVNSEGVDLHGLSFVEYNGGISAAAVKPTLEASGGDAGAINLSKTTAAIKYTPTENGKLTITAHTGFNNGREVYYGTVNTKDSDTRINDAATSVTLDLTANTTYFIYNASGSVIKIRSLSFAVTEAVEAGTPEYQQSIVKKVSVNENDTADGTVGTAIVATITNSGTADGTISSVDWKVTAGSVTKTTGALNKGMPQVTIANGGSVNIALYITGLNNKNATAELKINDTWQTVE